MQTLKHPAVTSSRAFSARRAFKPCPLTRSMSFRCLAKAKPVNEPHLSPVVTSTTGLLAPFLAQVGDALAKEGEYGILEGRTVALVHPLIMGVLFAGSLYAGYLGWQIRRTRELPEEIKQLKKQLPVKAEGEPAGPPSELEQKIAGLEQERKDLVKGGYRDKHWWWGNLLLAMGTVIAIEGALNTYFRTGKLFPGPHLFAGAGIVALWAVAASLVPEMQKGNTTARNTHIALNSINLALFAWNVPTGLEIVGKVFQFTSWP